MRILRLIVFLAVAAVVLVAVMSLPRTRINSVESRASSGGPLIPVWSAQTDQASATNPDGTFTVKGALVLPGELEIFYVINPVQAGIPQVIAGSCTPDAACSSLSVTSVKSLGNLGGTYDVGVILLAWTDRVHQTITIKATAPNSTASWSITPLQQQASVSDSNVLSYLRFPSGARDVQFEQGILGGSTTDATFKISLTSPAPSSPSQLFLKVDNQGTPSKITQTQYAGLNVVATPIATGSDSNAAPTSTTAPMQP